MRTPAALLLTGLLLLSAFACAPRPPGGTEKTDPNAPVTMEREAAPRACRVASAATALALRQYIAARLKTEAFVTADFKTTPPEELAVIFSNKSGTVLTGTYDESTATFIGRDLSQPEDVW